MEPLERLIQTKVQRARTARKNAADGMMDAVQGYDPLEAQALMDEAQGSDVGGGRMQFASSGGQPDDSGGSIMTAEGRSGGAPPIQLAGFMRPATRTAAGTGQCAGGNCSVSQPATTTTTATPAVTVPKVTASVGEPSDTVVDSSDRSGQPQAPAQVDPNAGFARANRMLATVTGLINQIPGQPLPNQAAMRELVNYLAPQVAEAAANPEQYVQSLEQTRQSLIERIQAFELNRRTQEQNLRIADEESSGYFLEQEEAARTGTGQYRGMNPEQRADLIVLEEMKNTAPFRSEQEVYDAAARKRYYMGQFAANDVATLALGETNYLDGEFGNTKENLDVVHAGVMATYFNYQTTDAEGNPVTLSGRALQQRMRNDMWSTLTSRAVEKARRLGATESDEDLTRQARNWALKEIDDWWEYVDSHKEVARGGTFQEAGAAVDQYMGYFGDALGRMNMAETYLPSQQEEVEQ